MQRVRFRLIRLKEKGPFAYTEFHKKAVDLILDKETRGAVNCR